MGEKTALVRPKTCCSLSIPISTAAATTAAAVTVAPLLGDVYPELAVLEESAVKAQGFL